MSVMDLFDTTGKVVIVTGASSGLGVSFARGFAEAGADVVLAARRAEKLADTAAAVGKALAEAAAAKGVKQVVFDRGQYKYHGRVKALADAAREGGLDF